MHGLYFLFYLIINQLQIHNPNYEIVQGLLSFLFNDIQSCFIAEARIKEPVLVRTLRQQSPLLNPLNKNPKEAKTGNSVQFSHFKIPQHTDESEIKQKK